MYFWVAIKEKGGEKQREERRWIIFYWKHSSCLEMKCFSYGIDFPAFYLEIQGHI